MSINTVIDISHFQTVTSFDKVMAAGITGVIHKATQSNNFQDPEYPGNRAAALKAGLLWGAYHFAGGNVSGTEQAQYFLDYAKPEPGVLLALDYEPNYTPGESSMTLEQAGEFVEEVYRQTGVYPGLYGGGSLLNGNLQDNTDAGLAATLGKCWLWFADYADEPQNVPSLWKTWTMWQYTGSGPNGQPQGPGPHTVDGIDSTSLDRDRFNGDLAALKNLWASGSSSVKPPAPPVPKIVYSKTEKSALGKGLQKFLNQFPGPQLAATGIPDDATSNRLREVAGIDLHGAPVADDGGGGGGGGGGGASSSFIIYDPSAKTDYGKLLETYLNSFDGIDLTVDGLPGQEVSAALETVFGSLLPGDPAGGGGPATPLIPYDATRHSQFAKQLQHSLNRYPGVNLTTHGIPGKQTSDAAERVLGNRLRYDPRDQA